MNKNYIGSSFENFLNEENISAEVENEAVKGIKHIELKIIPDTEESGYVAYYSELPGCITCGETIESAKANAEDAKREWLRTVFNDLIDEQNL